MKISFPTVKWDTFDKVWINFLISDDLSDWFLESEVNQRGWVKSSLGTHVGRGGFYVGIIYVIMVQLKCNRLGLW